MTGALWKDKINLIEIEMQLPKCVGFDLLYPREHSYRVDENSEYFTLFWKYTNIEPDFNIEVNMFPAWESNKTLDQYIVLSDTLIKKYGVAGVRYLRNLVFAHYGYPFKNPLIRGIFYCFGRYSENENYSENMISAHHREFLEKLNELEKNYKTISY